MTESARVTSIDEIRAFRKAVVKFSDDARQALGEAQSEVQRTLNRLQGEAMSYWQGQVKLWSRKVAEAKSELYKAQVQSHDERPSAAIERKNLEKAEQRLQHAQQKIEAIKKWLFRLDREAMLCRGLWQQLDQTLEGELPRVLAGIDKSIDHLQAYLQTIAPTTGSETDRAAATAARTAGPGEIEVPPDDLTNAAETPALEPAARAEVEAASAETVAALLDVMPLDDDALADERLIGLEIRRDAPETFDRLIIARDWDASGPVVLARTAAGQVDSGWSIMPAGMPAEPVRYRATTVGDVLAGRPDLAGLLALPAGFRVIVKDGRVASILDEGGREQLTS